MEVVPAPAPVKRRSIGQALVAVKQGSVVTRLRQELKRRSRSLRELYNGRKTVSRRRRRRSAMTDQIMARVHSQQSHRSGGRRLSAKASMTRSGSIVSRLGESYFESLFALFSLCDYDEDGKLTAPELRSFLTLLGLDAPPRLVRQGSSSLRNAMQSLIGLSTATKDDAGISFERFVSENGHRLLNPPLVLPSDTFQSRCRQLKLGFRRCDTNGDHTISLMELEIALQKLDVALTDDELRQLIVALDENHDGALEWSELLLAAWRYSMQHEHVSVETKHATVLLMDALADVPAPAIVRSRAMVGGKSTRVLPRGAAPRQSLTAQVPVPPPAAVGPRPPSIGGFWTRLAVKAHLFWTQQDNDGGRRAATTAQSVLSERSDDGAVGAPLPIAELRRTIAVKSRVENVGVQVLTRISMRQVATMKLAHSQVSRRSSRARSKRGSGAKTASIAALSVMPAPPPPRRASLGLGPASELPAEANATVIRSVAHRTRFPRAVRRRVTRIELTAIVLAAVWGVLCGLLSMRVESLIPSLRGEDETTGGTHYFAVVTLINIGVTLVEVQLMYLTAVVCAFRMTVATRLPLYPQDPEREFLTRAIARAALQVGHRKDRLFGMDPMKGSPRIVLLLTFVMYKSKRYVLKFLVKQFVKRVLWRAAAKTALNYIVLPINACLNAWTLRGVMRHCRVAIIGPPCVTALLEDFFARENALLLPFHRVDYVRVLGCALVCKRCVHPNLEIMVDQLRRQWVNAEQWPATDGCCCLVATEGESDGCEIHQLDDVNRLLASLLLYRSRRNITDGSSLPATRHARNMFCLLIMAFVIDGELSLSERRLYVRACHASRMQPRWPAIRALKSRFLSGKGLTLDAIYDTIERIEPATRSSAATASRRLSQVGDAAATENDDVDESTPLYDMALFLGDRIASLLAV
ncbi:hypothetical protein P43SY_004586 [Pythium insidiosum]|uniref:EF-hand domain-containing protein n=1 Tax=Pythium insidiosum TaxID=114742 RepID=A0AAD5Q738_PYTIN|nr:hypothetical protein P43SY_004586 [Pythium insidiosum]